MKSLLTDQDRNLICDAVYEIETGNYLLGRKTGITILLMISHIYWCQHNKDKLNDMNKEVLEYVDVCYSPDGEKFYNEKYEIKCQNNCSEQE